jgi:hypothetical protein
MSGAPCRQGEEMSEKRVGKVAFEYCRFDSVVDRNPTGPLIPYKVFFRLAGPPVKFCRIVVRTHSLEVAIDYVMKRFSGAQLLESAWGADASIAEVTTRFSPQAHGRELAPCLRRET